jgi:anionic cell wall polymer biosynthesis LytR-Cps2A-Psr (LCP) family protein
MTQKRIPIIIGVIVGIVLLCACGVGIAYMAWNTPLGPALNANPEVVFPTAEVVENLLPVGVTPLPPPASTQESGETVTNCGQSGSLNYLVMGVDAPIGVGPQGPLAIRIIKVDFSRKTATLFSFPRDLWLPVAGLESYGITQARLGEAYLIGINNAGFSTAAATNLVAQALLANFGATSNHYITAKLSTLAAAIDAAGGITVNIPMAYDGTPFGFHYFAAGPYFMTGALAMEYALAPSPLEQWSGLDRQTQVLMALLQKALSSEIIPKIPSLAQQFLQVVTTDLSMQQISDLICISQQIPLTSIIVNGVGPTNVSYGAGDILYPDMDAIRTKIKQSIGSE